MQKHRSGFVNIIGLPNVGKSTLMNLLIGETLSIVTHKAQTTRHRILGIVNGDDYQVVFSDTPGIINPAYKLQKSMMYFVNTAISDADVLLYMVQMGEKKHLDESIHKKFNSSKTPLLLVINKIDLADQDLLEQEISFWQEKFPHVRIFPISALEKFNISSLMDEIISLLPQHPPYFSKDTLTDKEERFFVNEIIREKILLYYKKEIPYSVEIVTESFLEEEKIIKIRSNIIVERDTQKGIIIGHKGLALKNVGRLSRLKLEVFFQKKIYLELFVKVDKNWRNDDRKLKKYNYNHK
ncbi:GTPase Era [Ichthyobacterium seriolicida]|nr:GTPase Era [Ichthyobacterium seriolicida]